MSFQDITNSLIAGAVAGASSLLVVHPLDTIRTRVQTNAEYKGVIDCFTKTIKTEGSLALYKGIIPPLFAQGLYKAIMFSSFTTSSRFIQDQKSTPGQPLTPFELFLCGSFAGVVNSTVVTPVELLRNNLMVARSNTADGPTVTVRSIVREALARNGIRGLWKGQVSCMMRDGAGVGAFFYSQNRAAKYLHDKNNIAFNLSPSTIQLFAGMVAGISFWLVALPLDRVKSIIQTQKAQSKSPFALFNEIFQTQGIRGLYRGLGAGLFRGIPGGAVTFYVNHQMMDLLKNGPKKKQVV